MSSTAAGAGFARRWLEYCRERFPPLQHGAVIAAFSFASVSCASAVGPAAGRTMPRAFALAFVVAFLCFLELRILDEFKDAKDDARFRPYRPVPRGLVSLRELRSVGLGAVLVQVVVATVAGHAALLLLLLAFAWMSLMAREFFVSAWLRARPVVYLASHTLVVPLIALVAAACTGERPRALALAPYLAFTCASSVVYEIGRKVRAPADERTGVETYSALWGLRRAVVVWFLSLAASAVLAWVTAIPLGNALPVAAVGVAALVAGATFGAHLVARPTGRQSSRVQVLSGLWLVAAYVVLGAVALGMGR